MSHQDFEAVLVQDDDTSGCGIELPFNPKDAFGRVRAPVVVTINGKSFRTTTCAMGGSYWVPVNRENRDAVGVTAGQRLRVRIEHDAAARTIEAPADLLKALRAAQALDAWKALSYTHQKEHVRAIEEAKKPETRVRRIEKAVEMVRGAKAGKRTRG